MRCSKYPPFTNTQAEPPIASLVRLTHSHRYATPCVRMDIHFLSSFVVKLVQSKRFSSFARELSHNSQWSVPYNKVQNFNKCFNFFSKRNLRGFLWHCQRLQKNRRLIITNTIENWYSELVKEVVINRFHLKMQLLPATRQDSHEFVFQYKTATTHMTC